MQTKIVMPIIPISLFYKKQLLFSYINKLCLVNQYPNFLIIFAEYENRTRVYCLGSSHSATKLIPLYKN